MNIKVMCENCGKEIPKDAAKCPYCNVEFEESLDIDNSYKSDLDKTVNGLYTWSKIIKVLSFVAAIIIIIYAIKSYNMLNDMDTSIYENPIIEKERKNIIFFALFYPIIIIISGFISSLIFRWLSHTLDCLHTLTKKK